MRFDSSFLDELRDRVRISDIIGKRAGTPRKNGAVPVIHNTQTGGKSPAMTAARQLFLLFVRVRLIRGPTCP